MSRSIDRTGWQAYFDRVSRNLQGQQAELEVASLGLGGQIASKWVAFGGIVYDPKDDQVEMVLEDLDHMIRQPREIRVDEDGLQLLSLEVVDREGVRHILKLLAPLMLPAPEARTRRDSRQAPRPSK